MKERLAMSLLELPRQREEDEILHGWPREANANLLMDTLCREPMMGYPDMKSLLCAMRKAS